MTPLLAWTIGGIIGVIIHLVILFQSWRRRKMARQLLDLEMELEDRSINLGTARADLTENIARNRGAVGLATLNMHRDAMLLLVQALFLFVGIAALARVLPGSVLVLALIAAQYILVMNSVIGFLRQNKIARGEKR